MKRTAEFVLGLIGGILCSAAGLVIIMLALVSGYVPLGNLPETGGVSGLSAVLAGVIVLIFALVGLFGAIIVKRKPTLAGILMIVSGILSLASGGFPWSILWATELIVAGVMACIPKKEVPTTAGTGF